jgi:hypothetical protein
MYDEIIAAAKKKKLIPFIGAGFSKNLNLPTLDDLITIMATELKWSPDILKLQGDFYQIAEYYSACTGSISSLRSKLDNMFNSSEIVIENSEIHSLLVKLNAPIIYTTNWDSWIEKSYAQANKPFQAIRGINDIINLKNDITQIVKFHGDFKNNDDDLVFTETSYFKRLNFESPLDIKLRSDILGKSVIFIGYSFTDINMRFLWFKLVKLIEETCGSAKKKYPKSFIVSMNYNPLLEDIYDNSNVKVVNLPEIDPVNALTNFLKSITCQTEI